MIYSELHVCRITNYHEKDNYWKIFEKHHYLSNKALNTGDVYVCFLKNKPIAYINILCLPSGTIKYYFNVHRLVVLPEYQGLGIAKKLLIFVGELYSSMGYKLYIKTAHYKLMNYFENSSFWYTDGVKYNKLNNYDDYDFINITKDEAKTTNKPFLASKKFDGKFHLSRWFNRPNITAKYVSLKEQNNEKINIIVENESNINEITNILTKYNKLYFVNVYCDNTSNNGSISKLCCNLGIQNDSLYYKHFNINNLTNYKCIYVYNDNNHSLLDNCKKLNVECLKVNCDYEDWF